MKTKLEEKIERRIYSYSHFLEVPLKIVGCWDWFVNPTRMYQMLVNYIYLGFVLFILVNMPVSLIVHLYTVWVDLMSSLDKIADGLPLVAAVAIVAYFATHKKELYELVQFMDDNFKWHSGRGLTNMTMLRSYRVARNFAYLYTACTIFSVAMYVFLPVLAHRSKCTGATETGSFIVSEFSVVMKQPLQPWIYMEVTSTPLVVLLFLRQCFAQAYVALAVGQLGVLFATTSILVCGQLDLLCCSLRNARYTALLAGGVRHAALTSYGARLQEDEQHNYLYNTALITDSHYHYDKKVINSGFNMTTFDIYSRSHDAATEAALRDCARVYQAVSEFKEKFERFVSPLLVLRVAQVTLYLCTLLYAVTLKFDMIAVEYLGAVALDMFVYCYFGNQITFQSDRVSRAAYQFPWVTAGVGPRRTLLGLLQASGRPLVLRAGRFLPMDLHTFLVIIKTSFSYYTLLISVNEK